jgi:ribonuclease P protein component
MFTFKKIERLCTKKDIELLYAKGSNKFIFPFRVYWRETVFESPYPVRVIISVPKRNWKRAVDRNRIKRLIKEAYRLNKNELYTSLHSNNKKLDLLFIYLHNEKPLSPELHKHLKKIFTVVGEEIIKF